MLKFMSQLTRKKPASSYVSRPQWTGAKTVIYVSHSEFEFNMLYDTYIMETCFN